MHAAAMGHNALLWAREPEVCESINNPAVKENTTYLKVYLTFQCARPCFPAAAMSRSKMIGCLISAEQGYKVPDALRATSDIAATIAHAEIDPGLGKGQMYKISSLIRYLITLA